MKSLLLYDFVGLYLAIRCNPYYGYPIDSKMKILAMAVASTFVFYPFILLCDSS